MVEKAKKEVEVIIRDEGEAATLETGVNGLHPELIRLLGKLNTEQVMDRMYLSILLRLLSSQVLWPQSLVWIQQ